MGMLSTQCEPTIHHMSHKHPLTLTYHNPTLTLAPTTCSGCKDPLSQGLTYTCKPCNYYLHIKCSQMPQQIKHPSDQAHVFSLLATPVYPGGVFKCDACGENGSGFSYHCRDCGTDLHMLCASMPLSVAHHSHHHNLDLVFSPPYLNKNFACDVCKEIGGSHWLYRCGLCGFDAHLSCGTSEVLPAQAHTAVQTNQYQHIAGVSVPIFQPPTQMPAQVQQYLTGYGAAAGISSPGTPYVNQQPFNVMDYVNRGADYVNRGAAGSNNLGAYQANQGMQSYTGAPQFARQQMFQGQSPGAGGGGNNEAMVQLLQAILNANNSGGGNMNADLLQAILSANNGGGGGGPAGGGANAQLFQALMNAGGGGGDAGGTGQLLQGLMGGGGGGGGGFGGGFDLNSLLGGLDVNSLMGMVTGFGII